MLSINHLPALALLRYTVSMGTVVVIGVTRCMS